MVPNPFTYQSKSEAILNKRSRWGSNCGNLRANLLQILRERTPPIKYSTDDRLKCGHIRNSQIIISKLFLILFKSTEIPGFQLAVAGTLSSADAVSTWAAIDRFPHTPMYEISQEANEISSLTVSVASWRRDWSAFHFQLCLRRETG